MQVDATFHDVGTGPLALRMSRTSPGRYALHEFAKNVFDVKVVDGAGGALKAERPNPHQWDVSGHDGTVRVTYRVFGDRTDGTYLSIDATHAHINIPSALIWARGLDTRPVTVRIESPKAWKVATQLFPTSDAAVFSAPNLQYLMDSPIELSAYTARSFTVPNSSGGKPATIRIALHHDGTDAEADRFAKDVERIVREEQAIYGELPAFDDGTYTFLADYRPSVNGDGMEHRNSTVLTSGASLATSRVGLLGTVAHEFFHSWNVERIRPRSLEPFGFEDANMSGELWFAEGFTSYYDSLVLARAGLTSVDELLRTWSDELNAVISSPARRFRSAVDMSRLAPFVDAARSIDPTNWDNTFISYYTFGSALGLGLDLSLRDFTAGRVSLDDYMRAMWATFGKPGGKAPGYVDKPYTLADLRATLAEVSGSRQFADEFFDRFIEGHEVVDYKRLLARAGFDLRRRSAGRAWLGDVRLEAKPDGSVVSAPVRYDTPAYLAGLAQGDVVVSVDGTALKAGEAFDGVIRARKPGDVVKLAVRRGAENLTLSVTLTEDPTQEIVRMETNGTLAPEAETFRKALLESRVRN